MATNASNLPGRPDNLTPTEDAKLRDLWAAIFKMYDIADGKVDEAAEPASPTPSKKSGGLFRWRSASSTGPESPAGVPAAGPNFNKDVLNKYLPGESSETLKSIISSMSKQDHPDSLVLRFLRARKWDHEATLNMMFTVLGWRHKEMHVDDKIMREGEQWAVEKAENGDDKEKAIAKGWLEQWRMGKSYWHGLDKENRPVSVIRVKSHNPKAQPPETMEKYIVHLIETARLFLTPPIDTVCVVFNLNGFSLSNMDYHAVKFVIQCFQTNYPECLGVLLIHDAPWIFQSIWKIIHGWLDPVVAAKVHFTNGRKGLEEYIASERLIKELSGDEDWEYEYSEYVPGENDIMKDTATRDKLIEQRDALYAEFEDITRKWVATEDEAERKKLFADRKAKAEEMRLHYWKLDPYIRARSHHDRNGNIRPDGSPVEWYNPVPVAAKPAEVDAVQEKLADVTLNGDDIKTPEVIHTEQAAAVAAA